MNKKVLTLCAGFLLAGAVGTANAQTWAHQVSKATAPSLESVEQVTDNRAYQLSNGHDVLVMQKVSTGDNAYHYQLAFVPYYEANVGESLWYVQQVKSNNENGVAFQFVNLAYNLPISFDPTKAQDFKSGNFKASDLGGNAIAWSWMRSEAGRDLQIARTPEAYITPDSVMTMVPLADGKVAAVKYATKEVKGKVDDLRIKPFIAGAVWLNKFDLNTMMQTKQGSDYKFQLAFEKGTTTENLWDKKYYKAVDPVATNTLSYGEVADAKAASDAAYEAYMEKQAITDAAWAQIGETNADIKEIAKKKSRLLTEELRVIHAVSMIREEYNSLLQDQEDASNDVFALEQAVLSNSKVSDDLKEQIQEALEVYKEADIKLSEATKNYAALSSDKLNENQKLKDLTAAEVSLRNQKNDVYSILEIASKFSNLQELESAYPWILGTTPDDESVKVNWENIFDALEVTTEYEKEAVVLAANDFYEDYAKKAMEDDPMLESTSFADWKDFSSLVGDYLTDVTGEYNNLSENLKDAETKTLAQQEVVNKVAEQLVAAKNVLAEYSEAHTTAQQAWTTLQTQYNLLADAGETTKAAYDEAVAKLDSIESELDEVGKNKEDLENQLYALNDDINDLCAQLDEKYGEFGIAKHKWLIADAQSSAAARIYQNLYAVYAHVNAIKTPYWLSLQAEDGKSYLMVDTAYVTENAGDQNLKFAVKEYKEFVDADSPMNTRDINGRFNFRFLYFPTQDSMRIEADGFNRKNVSTELWSQRHDDEITLRSSYIPGFEQNLVKVDVLGTQREVTIGNSENLKGTYHYTINDRIGFDFAYSTPETLPSGLYYMDVEASKDSQRNNARG